MASEHPSHLVNSSESPGRQAEKSAAPVPPRDRRHYYDLVGALLRRCPLLTNAALMDAIRAAQRELLRPPAEAV
jgi:hypothetical protein